MEDYLYNQENWYSQKLHEMKHLPPIIQASLTEHKSTNIVEISPSHIYSIQVFVQGHSYLPANYTYLNALENIKSLKCIIYFERERERCRYLWVFIIALLFLLLQILSQSSWSSSNAAIWYLVKQGTSICTKTGKISRVASFSTSYKTIWHITLQFEITFFMYNMLDGSKCSTFSRELRVLSGDVMGGREQRKKER